MVFDTDNQANFFKKNRAVLLHCITDDVFEVAIKDCDCLGIRVRVCHVSLPANLGIRRGILIPDRGDLKAESFRIPRVLSVDASCILRVSLN